MTDALEEIGRAMERATPAPDVARKAEAMRRAMAAFDGVQGSADQSRPSDRRGWTARIMDGATAMLKTMTTGGGLAATTALVAVGVILVLPEGREVLRPPAPAVVLDRAEVPKAEPRAVAPALTRNAVEQEAPALADAAPVAESLAAAPPPAPLGLTAARQRVEVPGDVMVLPGADTEAFANAQDNPLKVTAEAPVSTFSIDVDTASYAVVRSSLMAGALPPRDAVRVEEMVNYFPYAYPAPDGDAPFRPTVTVVPTPWNPGTELVHIAIRGRDA
jgi:Ca-activated chloride channel homolog